MKGTKENIETNGDIQTYKEKNTKETRETVETNVDTHQYKSARRDTRETMETNAGIYTKCNTKTVTIDVQ